MLESVSASVSLTSSVGLRSQRAALEFGCKLLRGHRVLDGILTDLVSRTPMVSAEEVFGPAAQKSDLFSTSRMSWQSLRLSRFPSPLWLRLLSLLCQWMMRFRMSPWSEWTWSRRVTCRPKNPSRPGQYSAEFLCKVTQSSLCVRQDCTTASSSISSFPSL